MISQPMNMKCPFCGHYKVEMITEIDPFNFGYHEITKYRCSQCGHTIEPPRGVTYLNSTDSSYTTASSAEKYCQNCNTKMEPFGDKWLSCPKCGYGYMDYIGDTPKDNLFIPCDNAWGVGYAYGSLEPDPFTVEIGNCNKIKLGHKELDINFEFDAKKIENIDTIIINGHKFVREK